MSFGYLEGDTCGREGCSGVIVTDPVRNCSCHLYAPCSQCTEDRNRCPECEWQGKDEVIVNDYRCHEVNGVLKSWEPRPLDPTKIDWRSASHTHFSMIKEGVYPPTATMSDVLEKVKGTFGGRFEYFHNGKFKYIAYTD
jgi:hypothetical protein